LCFNQRLFCDRKGSQRGVDPYRLPGYTHLNLVAGFTATVREVPAEILTGPLDLRVGEEVHLVGVVAEAFPYCKRSALNCQERREDKKHKVYFASPHVMALLAMPKQI
jgi:hypothetical protein